MMNNKACWLLLLLVVIASCKKNDDVKYDLSIPRSELVKIMGDLAMADAAASQFIGEKKDSAMQYYKVMVERIHNRQINEIDECLDRLYRNPELNRELQKEVLDSLKAIEDRWRNKKAQNIQ